MLKCFGHPIGYKLSPFACKIHLVPIPISESSMLLVWWYPSVLCRFTTYGIITMHSVDSWIHFYLSSKYLMWLRIHEDLSQLGQETYCNIWKIWILFQEYCSLWLINQWQGAWPAKGSYTFILQYFFCSNRIQLLKGFYAKLKQHAKKIDVHSLSYKTITDITVTFYMSVKWVANFYCT